MRVEMQVRYPRFDPLLCEMAHTRDRKTGQALQEAAGGDLVAFMREALDAADIRDA